MPATPTGKAVSCIPITSILCEAGYATTGRSISAPRRYLDPQAAYRCSNLGFERAFSDSTSLLQRAIRN
jgi:hypothetical protein